MDRERLFGDAKATARVGDAQRKKKALDSALANAEADPTTENKIKLASALFDVGRFDEAEKIYQGLMDTIGSDMKLLSDLGFVYKNLGQSEQAEKIFRRVIEIDPKHALARSAENELWMINPEYKPSWMRKDK